MKKNLIGKKFGRLCVLSECGYKIFPSGQKTLLWNCLCECGKEKVILGKNLKNGSTNSCGCIQKERTSKARRCDISGNIYGKLTALEFSHTDVSGQSYWNCQCECGNIKKINTSSLKSGRSKSCGCKQGRFIHGMWGKPGYKAIYLKDPVKKIRHVVSNSIRSSLKNLGTKKGYSVFDYLPYTPQDLKKHLENQFEEWMNWDNYGGWQNEKRKTWWIDHIIPQSSFEFSSMNDPRFLKCWSLENLRPLEKIENIKKGNNILP